jgi:hypothetical protein
VVDWSPKRSATRSDGGTNRRYRPRLSQGATEAERGMTRRPLASTLSPRVTNVSFQASYDSTSARRDECLRTSWNRLYIPRALRAGTGASFTRPPGRVDDSSQAAMAARRPASPPASRSPGARASADPRIGPLSPPQAGPEAADNLCRIRFWHGSIASRRSRLRRSWRLKATHPERFTDQHLRMIRYSRLASQPREWLVLV